MIWNGWKEGFSFVVVPWAILFALKSSVKVSTFLQFKDLFVSWKHTKNGNFATKFKLFNLFYKNFSFKLHLFLWKVSKRRTEFDYSGSCLMWSRWNVISCLLWSDFFGPIQYTQLHIITGKCYHSVNIISFSWSLSDHIKRLPLYNILNTNSLNR